MFWPTGQYQITHSQHHTHIAVFREKKIDKPQKSFGRVFMFKKNFNLFAVQWYLTRNNIIRGARHILCLYNGLQYPELILEKEKCLISEGKLS